MSEALAPRDPEFEQCEMILGDEALAMINLDRSEPVFNYTGERFKAWYPDRYAMAIKLLATNQLSDRTIARFCHADYRTIQQVRLHQIKDIEEQRAILRQTFFVGMMAFTDKALELLDKATKPAEAMIPAGICKDAWLQVGGLPTANVEVTHKIDFGAALDKLHAELAEKVKQVQGRVVDEPPPALTEGGAAA